MKVSITCKLPAEIPLAVVVFVAGILATLGIVYGLSWLATNVLPAIVSFVMPHITAALSWNLLPYIVIAALPAIFGFIGESNERTDHWARMLLMLMAFIVFALVSLLYAMVIGTTTDYSGCSSAAKDAAGMFATCAKNVMTISSSGFIQSIVTLCGGFTAGWLLSWCTRCIKIERG